MLSPSITTYVLTIAPTIALTVLFVQAVRRRLLRQYSVFMIYAGLQLAKGIIAPGLYGHYKTYFVAYWLGELLDIPLVVAVLYQLYSQLFLGFQALRRLQDLLFRWSAAVCVLTAVVTAALASGSDADRLMDAVVALDLAAAVLKAGLIVFLMSISSTLSLRWAQYAFGILIGMGLYNSVVLADVIARVQFGRVAAMSYGVIKVVAYNCAIGVWLAYFFQRQRARLPVNAIPVNDLASWNQALLELLGK